MLVEITMRMRDGSIISFHVLYFSSRSRYLENVQMKTSACCIPGFFIRSIEHVLFDMKRTGVPRRHGKATGGKAGVTYNLWN